MKNLLAALCGVALLAGCVLPNKPDKKAERPLKVLLNAPEFKLENVLGGHLKSSDLKGKPVSAST